MRILKKIIAYTFVVINIAYIIFALNNIYSREYDKWIVTIMGAVLLGLTVLVNTSSIIPSINRTKVIRKKDKIHLSIYLGLKSFLAIINCQLILHLYKIPFDFVKGLNGVFTVDFLDSFLYYLKQFYFVENGQFFVQLIVVFGAYTLLAFFEKKYGIIHKLDEIYHKNHIKFDIRKEHNKFNSLIFISGFSFSGFISLLYVIISLISAQRVESVSGWIDDKDLVDTTNKDLFNQVSYKIIYTISMITIYFIALWTNYISDKHLTLLGLLILPIIVNIIMQLFKIKTEKALTFSVAFMKAVFIISFFAAAVYVYFNTKSIPLLTILNSLTNKIDISSFGFDLSIIPTMSTGLYILAFIYIPIIGFEANYTKHENNNDYLGKVYLDIIQILVFYLVSKTLLLLLLLYSPASIIVVLIILGFTRAQNLFGVELEFMKYVKLQSKENLQKSIAKWRRKIVVLNNIKSTLNFIFDFALIGYSAYIYINSFKPATMGLIGVFLIAAIVVLLIAFMQLAELGLYYKYFKIKDFWFVNEKSIVALSKIK